MQFFDFLFSFEQALPMLLQEYGLWLYIFIFIIIFLETGCIFMFFLPGDSLLLSIGALCATVDSIHLLYMTLVLFLSTALGYIANYYTGLYFSTYILNCRFFAVRQEHLDKTDQFFQRHGGKTIILARFVPFVRTFAPFAAGSSGMTYPTFILYNFLGALLWVGLLLGLGYVGGTTFLWLLLK
ncbi:VTT domain-containing protein [Acinetobacter sp. MB5]|uniref:VTT domain-containing protein n=1 Tax=Acinetobacter sp. MB5 TaxID=2069438 RepID=UPI000DCF74E6|nr:VTT domain-containing protein [Acinetobacter sp. MB5]